MIKDLPFDYEELQQYLEELFGAEIQIKNVRQLGGDGDDAAALKQFGYGRPFLVSYLVGDRNEQIVFHRIRRNAFGRERDDDRAAAVWFDFNTFNRLPFHVPAVDMIVHTTEGKMQSIKRADELLLATAYRPGHPYADDLMRIRNEENLRPLDIARAEALATYLATIHQTKHDDPILWRRRLRDLIGHGEGIMGLTDSYPEDLPYISQTDLRLFEEMANQWRWRLKPLTHRLSQVHGDFHPFNILFKDKDEFYVLDRSRGEWGEPADDVSCMTLNYLFFSLQKSGRLEGSFRELHDRFWEQYLAIRPDTEMLTVIQPWFAWRVLVVASPLWYPNIKEEVRKKLLLFAKRVMSADNYDYPQINQYIEDI
jgi:thiamine kinase-like enzyme